VRIISRKGAKAQRKLGAVVQLIFGSRDVKTGASLKEYLRPLVERQDETGMCV
jgi:hypothetical protein